MSTVGACDSIPFVKNFTYTDSCRFLTDTEMSRPMKQPFFQVSFHFLFENSNEEHLSIPSHKLLFFETNNIFHFSQSLLTEIPMIQRFRFFYVICSMNERSAIFKNNHSFFSNAKGEQELIRFYFS